MSNHFFRHRKICFFILFLFCFLRLNAVPSNKYSLVVNLKDGTTQTFVLSSRPFVLLEGNQFVISQAESNIEFSISNVVDFSFADIEVAVHSIYDAGMTVSYTDNNHLLIYGVKDGIEIGVTNLEGKRIPCSISNLEGNVLSVSLVSLQQGVYIVSIGKNHNFKIVKK